MLGPQDVGYRVVVRQMVGIREDRPLFSDALGELVGYDDEGVTIATPGGARRIAHRAVHAAKRVPRSAREITKLERVASAAWPAPVRDRLGDWELRAADGWTGRANSALPLGNPGLDRPEAIAAVIRWYRARGLPARLNVPLPVCAALDADLTARGWLRSPVTLVLTAPVDRVLARTPARPDLPPVSLDPAPDDAWLAVVGARKLTSACRKPLRQATRLGLPPAAREVLTGPPLVRFASVARDRAVARGAVVDGYLHLGLLEVAEEARRQGLARHVTRALAEWAVTHRAGTAFLQVEAHNTAARQLYTGLGFTVHHEYTTRTAPQ